MTIFLSVCDPVDLYRLLGRLRQQIRVDDAVVTKLPSLSGFGSRCGGAGTAEYMVKEIGDYAAAGAAATPNARLHARPPLKGPLVAELFAAIIGGPPGCA